MKIEVALFRFDYKSDYLPYYKKYFLKLTEEKTLLDLLNSMYKQEKFEYENSESFIVNINNRYISCKEELSKIIDYFGNELKIEPISIRRCMNDLIINEDDFYAKLSLLEEFLTKEEIEKYETYKIYYYASNSFNFEKDYIGDAIIILANDLIQKQPKNKEAILNTLKACEYGVQYHTDLSTRVFNFDEEIEKTIRKISALLSLEKSEDKQNFKINKKTTLNFKEINSEVIENSFKGFSICYYGNKQKTINYLNKLDSKYISLDTQNIDLAKNSFHINKDFTFKLASSVLLEAFDKGANFLVVDEINNFYLFDFNRKELNKVAGREVNIPVLHINELKALACGEIEVAKNSLKQHYINPEIV